jgi:hypothetical protein
MKLRKLFNFVSFILLLWTIISGVYLALPLEYKALIPEFNWLTALVSGGSTGILGTSILVVDKYMKNASIDSSNKYLDLAKQFLALNEKYLALENKVNTSIETQNNTNVIISETNRLLKIDLESKLSNPLIEDFIKEKIRGEISERKE